MSIPQGFAEAAAVIAVTFCVGGAFGVVKRIGVIFIGVAALARRMSRRGIMVIPVLMVAFVAIAAFIGTQELSLIYVPIILPLMLALGFDSMTAAATALCATTAGFTGAITNPFTVGLAQKISDVPLYSGAGYRFVVLVVLTSVTILYVMRYASRVRRDPSKSLVRETDVRWREEFAEVDETAHTRATTWEMARAITPANPSAKSSTPPTTRIDGSFSNPLTQTIADKSHILLNIIKLLQISVHSSYHHYRVVMGLTQLAPMKATKTPNWAAAPRRKVTGLARSGPKSVSAPIPRKMMMG